MHCSSIEISLPKLPGAHTMHHVFACVYRILRRRFIKLLLCYVEARRRGANRSSYYTRKRNPVLIASTCGRCTHSHTHTHAHLVGGSGDLYLSIVFAAKTVLIEIVFENRPAARRAKSRPTHSAAETRRRRGPRRFIYYSATVANSPAPICVIRHITIYASVYIYTYTQYILIRSYLYKPIVYVYSAVVISNYHRV